MNMSSPSTQFAPTTRMGIFEPFHHMSIWEDTFRGDIMPGTGACMVAQPNDRVNDRVDDKSGYTSSEQLIPSGSEDNQAGKSVSEKVQRRLAQNREAARKSRMRKKAYVQQLETSRMKLAQLEMELERARQQGLYVLGSNGNMGLSATINPGIAAFEIEYGLWVEEQQKKNVELRNVLQSHVSEMELQLLVESVLSQYYNLFRMKADAAKADVFYLMSGMWRTSVERFFLWIGGFKPSELINVVMPQLEPLSDQQIVKICNLRHCCQQAEDALTQGMDKLQQTLAQSILTMTTGMGSYSSQMLSSMEKLEALESFVNQADHLRHQTLQQMSLILTTRQTARGLLAFGEYLQRLRALSSLWAARPREPT
ncbi:transcription factor TGA1 [Nicotiana tabacum]|uniref:Transcription factor TGA1 n=2 Tax=Nicotiana TaxID=4085 RepID=A0A1S4CSG8_TOBAC|nr:PREDICTED: transcription factor TGA1 [Nicotiana sylvestris]XP_016503964.1 PREDICTED: transcription factor TGA1-like [Nicotiana tabacum]